MAIIVEVIAPAHLAEVGFKRSFEPFAVTKCEKKYIKDGYKVITRLIKIDKIQQLRILVRWKTIHIPIAQYQI